MNKIYAVIPIVILTALISAYATLSYLSNKYNKEKLALEGRIAQLESSQESDEERVLSGCSNLGSKDQPLADPKGLGTAVYSKIEKATKGEWDKIMTVKCYNSTFTAAQGKYAAGYEQWGWFAWRVNTMSSWNVLVSLDGFDCNEYNQVPTNILTELQLSKSACYDHST